MNVLLTIRNHSAQSRANDFVLFDTNTDFLQDCSCLCVLSLFAWRWIDFFENGRWPLDFYRCSRWCWELRQHWCYLFHLPSLTSKETSSSTPRPLNSLPYYYKPNLWYWEWRQYWGCFFLWYSLQFIRISVDTSRPSSSLSVLYEHLRCWLGLRKFPRGLPLWLSL